VRTVWPEAVCALIGGALLALAYGELSRAGEQPEPAILSGEWTATVGAARTLRGKWIGQALPGEPEAVHGSWTLTNPAGKTVMTGMWAARKTSRGWQGTWSAEDRTERRASGTWRADANPDLKGTLQSMLELASRQELSGNWRSGGLRGHWWLKGKPSPAQRKPTGEVE